MDFLKLKSEDKQIGKLELLKLTEEITDEEELAKSKEAKDLLNVKNEDYNETVGFIGYEKNNKYLVFKTKDVFAKRNKGARCDESGKEKTMTKLNQIIGKQLLLVINYLIYIMLMMEQC